MDQGEATPKTVLTIAGFDPSSGAGATADLKTIAAHRLYGIATLTALTVQTTQGVSRWQTVEPRLVQETLAALATDTPPDAVKIGMLGSGEVAAVVRDFLSQFRPPNVVLDPVLRSSSGADLIDPAGVAILARNLFESADVITPNLPEGAHLTGVEVNDLASMEEACRRLLQLGARNVVITGGHLSEPTDILATSRPDEGVRFRRYLGERIATPNTHGTGCAFSTALACNLASGSTVEDAVSEAKKYVTEALRNSYPVGKGVGPINHLFGCKARP
jgi:hydroxymethylpyrimidine kinase/phosphomethylpyrimidine kinase